MKNVFKLIVGISGASGAIYGIRLLEVLRKLDNIETYLIISKAGFITITHETKYSVSEVQKLADHNYHHSDISSPISSGSFKVDGMIIAPCSMKTLGSIANGIEDNLITRAASVMLKERRKIVLVTRETPLHLSHIDNMHKVTQCGGIIAPPVPAFYNNPQSIEDLIEHSVLRILDLFDIDTNNKSRWNGLGI